MKKILKTPVFTFILGALIFGSIGVFATISASSITYNNTTVDLALDDLYGKASKYKTLSFYTTLQGWTKNSNVNNSYGIGQFKNKYNTVIIKLKNSSNGTCSATFYDKNWENPTTVTYNQEYPTNSDSYVQLSLGGTITEAGGYCSYELTFTNNN